MKYGFSFSKLIQSTDKAVNKNRRAFLKQGFLLMSSTISAGCGSDEGDSGASEEGQPPTITTQPSDISVFAEERATFQVLVEGTEPFTYQWLKNAVNIPGANTSSYTTPVLEISDTAGYSVEVVNGSGSTLSREAVLTVTRKNITVDQTSITVDSTKITIDGT